MKKVALVLAILLALGSCVMLYMSITRTSISINTEKHTGVYDRETSTYDGTIGGWSSSGGFGSAFEEIKAAADTAYTRDIVLYGVAAGVFALAAIVLGVSVKRGKARHA